MIFSTSLYFTLRNSAIISLLKKSKPAKFYPRFSNSIWVPLFSTSLTCNSKSFSELSSNILFNPSIISPRPSGVHCPGVVIQKPLFPSVILKTEWVSSKRWSRSELDLESAFSNSSVSWFYLFAQKVYQYVF